MKKFHEFVISNRIFIISSFLCVLFLVIGRIINLENFSLNVWGDRDLWRGLSFGTNLPSTGPETNSGFRPLGNFFYLLINFIFSIWPNIKAANLGVTFLFLFSIISVSSLLWFTLSRRAAAVAALAMTGCGLAKSTLLVWNPGFIIFFASTFVVFTYLFVLTEKGRYLGIAIFMAILGTQIHLQILMLVAALPLFFLIYKIKLTKFQIVSILIAVLLGYAPSLYNLDFNGFLNFSLQSTGDSVFGNFSQYSSIGITGLSKRLIDCLNAMFLAIGGSGTQLASALSFKYFALTIVLWAADLVALILVGYYLLMLCFYRNRISFNSKKRFGVFTIFVLFALVIFSNSEVNFRHFVFLIPVFAIIVAIGAEQLFQALKGHNSPILYYIFGLPVLLLLCARTFITGGVDYGSASFHPKSYIAQTEIATHVKSRYFSKYSDFEQKSSMFVADGDQLKIANSDIGNRMSSIFLIEKRKGSTALNAKFCLMIIPKEGLAKLKADTLVQLIIKNTKGFVSEVITNEVSETVSFFYLPYLNQRKNCFKSFSNPYIPSDFEAIHLKPNSNIFVDNATPLNINGSRAGFLVRSAKNLFPWAITLDHHDNTLRATIRGRPIRGHTGLPTQKFSNSSLTLTDGVTVLSLYFGDNTIGEWSTGILAPWNSETRPIASGVYNVSLNFAKSNKSSNTIELGYITISDGTIRTSLKKPI